MASKLEQYAEIQALVQKEIETQFPLLYAKYADKYGVAKVPLHYHTGSDAPKIPPAGIQQVEFLSAAPGGVASLEKLGRQVIDNPAEQGVGNPSTVPVIPLPIIYGFGTTTAITFTNIRPVGATSGTLTAPWAGNTETYAIQFQSGEVVNGSFTNGSATVPFDSALQLNAISANAVVIADSRFKGGTAPDGTIILFRNDDDFVYQLWFRSQPTTVDAAWWGFDVNSSNFVYD